VPGLPGWRSGSTSSKRWARVEVMPLAAPEVDDQERAAMREFGEGNDKLRPVSIARAPREQRRLRSITASAWRQSRFTQCQ
jgi:hypothetical protein